jgi:NTP pyrophosphatase (non-canonical NTP hydrolase)
MDFNEYQQRAKTTAVYPNVGYNPTYPALGLAGEVGEVCEQVKKMYRDDRGWITDERREALTREMGDVLWYLSTLATELNISLDYIAKQNLEKLAARKEKGVLHGSGSDR